MVDRQNINRQILSLIPQRRPFRFVDRIVRVDARSISGEYRFRPDEYFYQGHFPEKPVTPGVILIEAMAQTGVVAMGIHTLLQQGVSPEEVRQTTTLFTLVENVEFRQVVLPGEQVRIHGEVVYFRRGTLRSKVVMENQHGKEICAGILSGSGVQLHEA